MHALFYIFIIACVYCFVNQILMFIINFLILNEYKSPFAHPRRVNRAQLQKKQASSALCKARERPAFSYIISLPELLILSAYSP